MNFSSFIKQHQRYIVIVAVLLFFGILYLFILDSLLYWFYYWWMFPIAFVIALTVNTVGISGAALFVPFFILVFPSLAHSTLKPIDTIRLGLITESFGLSSSALAFFAFGLVDVILARRTIVKALPFVFAGALIVFFIPKAILYIIIALLLLISIVLLHYEHYLKQKRLTELQAQQINTGHRDGERVFMQSRDGKQYRYCRTKEGEKKRFIGYSVGALFQGAAGFGIGEMGIISMMLTHVPTRIAIGTSHFIVAGTAIVASLLHFLFSFVPSTTGFPWNIPFMTVPAVILGGQMAPYVAAKLSSKYLERFVSILFIVIALALIILAFNS